MDGACETCGDPNWRIGCRHENLASVYRSAIHLLGETCAVALYPARFCAAYRQSAAVSTLLFPSALVICANVSPWAAA